MEKSFIRILDTNLNRTKEGLRVIEDSARFVFNNEEIYKQLRTIRHKATSFLESKYEQLISERDSIKDVGRKATEDKRTNLKNIIIANFKRVEESLRVLEEYSKLIDFEIALNYKELRYGIYQIEKDFVKLLNEQKN
ncbi:thiamine-phosphate pyrophosphorylase [Candidatus Ruminimicrobium bovinum]|uniref:thiamine-phosphate pyrophosphorylase n=1 Tax=Candidatus Ruminimicrobium bovinum TaxID=3242779 RepID=UPI0039B8E3F5